MVEEYLTDRDQEEALRNWWRENWKWILAGVALGLGLLAAYQYWQTYQAQRASAAAKVYADLQKALTSNDLDQAGRLLTDLASDHPKSGYTQQGHLLLAKRAADAGKLKMPSNICATSPTRRATKSLRRSRVCGWRAC
jgi:predicted negative regulator of RcsB-dependent stress response